MIGRFSNRSEAGRILAARLLDYEGRDDAVVLALPRGGVPVGFEIARRLHLGLDVLIVRKLGVPGHEELAMGAIATGGIRLLNRQMIASLGIPQEAVGDVEQREQAELARRERSYRGELPPLDVAGKTVILVDDGIATGSTMLAAIHSLRQRGIARLIVAAPVAPADVIHHLRQQVDELHCAIIPGDFGGVGWWYDDFSQTSDEEVHRLLDTARNNHGAYGEKTSGGRMP